MSHQQPPAGAAAPVPESRRNGHGNGALAGLSTPSGKRLAAAAAHLNQAKAELLRWVRDSYVETNNVSEGVDDVMTILGYAKSVESMASKLDVRATQLGRE